MTRAKTLLILGLAAVTGIVAGSYGPARAQLPTLPGNDDTTTTTQAPTSTTAAPTPTTAAPTPTTSPDGEPGGATTTTTQAPPPAVEPPAVTVPPGSDVPIPGGEQPPVPGAPEAQPGPSPPAGEGAVPGAQPGPGQVPLEAQAAMNAVRRSRANNTRKLLTALAPLQELGLSEQEAIAAGFGRFPVGGYATYSHDWLFPRFTPTFHLHQGTDLFAATGTPVRSPADGTLKLSQGGSGGLAAYVYQADGTYYYMAHLSAFVPGQAPGQKVALGEVVGFVGDSGNAKGGTPHLHFEIHPAPSRAVTRGKGKNRTVTHVTRPVPVGSVLPAADPKATLDLWLDEALAGVPKLIAAFESRPRALLATGITRRLGDGRSGSFPSPVAPPLAQLLWASSASPSGGTLRLAQAHAMVAANEFNWTLAVRRQQERLEAQALAVARTEALLGPLTPPALRPSLNADA